MIHHTLSVAIEVLSFWLRASQHTLVLATVPLGETVVHRKNRKSSGCQALNQQLLRLSFIV